MIPPKTNPSGTPGRATPLVGDRTIVRYLDATLPTLAENLALDEALLIEAEENRGPSVLRTWEWGSPAVVMGASCRVLENLHLDACRTDGVEIARRSSGGGTVVI